MVQGWAVRRAVASAVQLFLPACVGHAERDLQQQSKAALLPMACAQWAPLIPRAMATFALQGDDTFVASEVLNQMRLHHAHVVPLIEVGRRLLHADVRPADVLVVAPSCQSLSNAALLALLENRKRVHHPPCVARTRGKWHACI